MSIVEGRLEAIEARLALQDVVTAYCTAVDSLSDIEGLLNCFTEDAVLDLAGIELPCLRGHGQIREFFRQAFAAMTHHAHYVSNFHVDLLTGNEASCRNYVMGMGISHGGRSITVYARYQLDCVRTLQGWKIRSFLETKLMPLPPEMTGIHAHD